MTLPGRLAIGGERPSTAGHTEPRSAARKIIPSIGPPPAIACLAVGQDHHQNKNDDKPDGKQHVLAVATRAAVVKPSWTYPKEKGRRGGRHFQSVHAQRSNGAVDHHMLDCGNCLGRVQTFGAGFRAVHDGVAAVQFERIFQIVQTLACRLIARIDDPAISM